MKYLFFIYFVSGFVLAQQPTIPFINETLTVDGNLGESVWEQATEFTNFNNFYPIDEGLANNQTKVKVFHNGEHLYIAAIYDDTTAENIIGSLKRDAHLNTVVYSDAFGIAIDPFKKENNGYYFTVNAGNAQLDALINFDGTSYDINESWNATWQSAVTTKGNKKHYELAIPFKALNYDVNNNTWGIQFFYRDFKVPNWTILSDMSRNYFQYDLRFTQAVTIEQLPKNNTSRFTATPSLTYNYQEQLTENKKKSTFVPSLDVQYNITSSLRLDATINPDFSQVDVDEQVTNLTRFAFNFPERRNFFLENSDLFNTLGTAGVNPFYSRRIGGKTDMQFGLKLSGNVLSNTRIGLLNAQTEKSDTQAAQNYSVLVGRQKLSDAFTTSGYLVARQETENFTFKDDYNRVTGINLNYKSKNNKWSGQTNYAKSFSDRVSDNNDFFNIESEYNTRETYLKGAFKTVRENFITDVGFTPRLYNYDAITNTMSRNSYLDSYVNFQKRHYPKNSKVIDNYRYLYIQNDAFWDGKGALTESQTNIGNTIWFKKNLSAIYAYLNHEYTNLNYGFDLLRNGNPLAPDQYNSVYTHFGYNNTSSNKNFYYRGELSFGSYFNGKRTAAELFAGYRLMPFATVSTYYEQNRIDLNELGSKTFHLVKFTGEVFFTNRLNWTTYVQYNNQINNFNINSRLQWEYKPLSYVYLVVTDNFDDTIYRTNWGVAFKMNYRFDF